MEFTDTMLFQRALRVLDWEYENGRNPTAESAHFLQDAQEEAAKASKTLVNWREWETIQAAAKIYWVAMHRVTK